MKVSRAEDALEGLEFRSDIHFLVQLDLWDECFNGELYVVLAVICQTLQIGQGSYEAKNLCS